MLHGGRVSPPTVWWRWRRPSSAKESRTVRLFVLGFAIDTCARHPYDDGVVLGGIGILRKLPKRSTRWCPMPGDRQGMRDDIPHVEVR